MRAFVRTNTKQETVKMHGVYIKIFIRSFWLIN